MYFASRRVGLGTAVGLYPFYFLYAPFLYFSSPDCQINEHLGTGNLISSPFPHLWFVAGLCGIFWEASQPQTFVYKTNGKRVSYLSVSQVHFSPVFQFLPFINGLRDP
jgi:hypothetical protein